jgi:hypothetical protein
MWSNVMTRDVQNSIPKFQIHSQSNFNTISISCLQEGISSNQQMKAAFHTGTLELAVANGQIKNKKCILLVTSDIISVILFGVCMIINP